MDEPKPFSYDEMPYPSWSFTNCHPDPLATVATLLGMQPPPVERCRVLELGCASGGNLIPMAYGIPGGEFVGIDLSAREVNEGRESVAALGLKNIDLRQSDIMGIDDSFGQFDYILAHGIYSWVPPAVQEKMLEICRRNLAPNGVAYISYNTYPGWHLLGTVRDMMLYHVRGLADLQARASAARQFLEFLCDSVRMNEGALAEFLGVYLKYMREHMMPKDDAHLVHDELSEYNQPLYFSEFAERAARHGLQYLADTEFQSMLASNLPAGLSDKLRTMVTTTIELEQYMDFLRNRSFRHSLLCHQEVELNSRLDINGLARLYFGSLARPETQKDEVDLASGCVERFVAYDGARLDTDHPITKAAMLCLADIWPKAMRLPPLLTAARQRLNGSTASRDAAADHSVDAQVLAANLLSGYGRSYNLVELHSYLPHFLLEVSERPVASPVARFQLQRGVRATNLRHERIQLEGLTLGLFTHLDGTNDRAALLRIAERLRSQESGSSGQTDDTLDDELPPSGSLSDLLEKRLRQLARAALLVG